MTEKPCRLNVLRLASPLQPSVCAN